MERKLGFGCMRLPMKGNEVDYDEFNKMIDYYFEHGFNYFDTAHGYIGGKSETAIRDCLASRYKREDYVLTNKLTSNYPAFILFRDGKYVSLLQDNSKKTLTISKLDNFIELNDYLSEGE